MAGKARFKAMVEQLDQLGGLEWVLEKLEDAVSMLSMAEELSRRAGTEITRGMLSKWVHEQPGGADASASARARGASAIVEQRAKMIDQTKADRDEIALAKLKGDEMKDRAGWYDKQYSMQKGAEVVINVQSLHLDALRVRAPDPAHIVTKQHNLLLPNELPND